MTPSTIPHTPNRKKEAEHLRPEQKAYIESIQRNTNWDDKNRLLPKLRLQGGRGAAIFLVRLETILVKPAIAIPDYASGLAGLAQAFDQV